MAVIVETNRETAALGGRIGPRPARYMIDPDDALQLVQDAAARREPCYVPLEDACGLRLAEEIRADRPQPAFDRAMMDGYGVRVADAGHTVEVVAEIAAGASSRQAVRPGQCVEIMTGAPCPPEVEAVVPKENARRLPRVAYPPVPCSAPAEKQPVPPRRVTLPRQVLAGQHIEAQGTQCVAGSVVLRPGDAITPLAVAVMASFGLTRVRVTPKPRLGVIATGAELVSPETQPGAGQIRDSNGPMLCAMARDVGLDRPVALHAEDRLEAIVKAIHALADRDIVLVTGGVSVGNHDLVPDAMQEYGAEAVFHKARQKPGKPLLFARKGAQLLFGLPGNPLACHFCFHRYVTAAVRGMAGKPSVREVLSGRLTEPVHPKAGRTYFVPAEAARDPHTCTWAVRPTPGMSSADVFRSSHANCYLQVPPARAVIPAGETLSFSWIAGVSVTC